MKSKLSQDLIDKYPSLFNGDLLNPKDLATSTHTKSVPRSSKNIKNFGIECGDGWYTIIDHLLRNIDQHIKHTNDWLKKGSHRYNFLRKLSYNLRVKSSCNQKIRIKLGEWIEKNSPKVYAPLIIFNVAQIKEKFGTLRFYYIGGDEKIAGMVSMAESISYYTCETCGSTHNIGQTQGWIRIMCKSCYENSPQKDKITWNLRKG